ncbi:twitching motility protein PilT [Spirochaetia bacterium]|nr:twitching motility protein PilT [Spirochaetia bacterium]
MVYVLDASFSAAVILPDETSAEVKQAFSAIGEKDEISVPHLWWYEMGNLLRKNVIRKRYTYEMALSFVAALSTFYANTDSSSGALYTQKLFQLAEAYELSVYDAAYLELALRGTSGLTALYTLDKGLKTAAISAGLTVA